MSKRLQTLAHVFSFDIKFTGTRRTSFYRKLFGFSTRVRYLGRDGSTKTYQHISPGLLTGIPHLKLGKSVIAVPAAAAPKLSSFFSSPAWQPMELHSFDAILPADLRLRAMEEALGRSILVGHGEQTSLTSEIAELCGLAGRGGLSPEVTERIHRTLRAAEELVRLDWSDDQEFSNKLETQLAILRKSV
ncbi:MAG: hypothetical protein QMC89_01305 [Candidatus Hodarchaeaceae archaeon]|nr:hypothetical protein [Candidatus Hodarchaeaceae archaeon]